VRSSMSFAVVVLIVNVLTAVAAEQPAADPQAARSRNNWDNVHGRLMTQMRPRDRVTTPVRHARGKTTDQRPRRAASGRRLKCAAVRCSILHSCWRADWIHSTEAHYGREGLALPDGLSEMRSNDRLSVSSGNGRIDHSRDSMPFVPHRVGAVRSESTDHGSSEEGSASDST
jgi:hypothetical protein